MDHDPPHFSEETWSFYINGYPTSPSIIAPANGAFIDSLTYLTWLSGTDPDSFDAVSYQIQVDGDSAFTSPEVNDTVTAALLLDNSVSIRIQQLNGYQALTSDQNYFWRVRSLDNYGLVSAWPDSLNWFVYQHQNHAPDPPVSGFSPADFGEVVSLNPTITWNNASDPDPDDHPGTLRYIFHLFSDTSTGCGFEYWDTTDAGVNQVIVTDTMPDNCLWIYVIWTLDDGGLISSGSSLQWFWTNHYNYPPEPFPLYLPAEGERVVAFNTYFSWGHTIDYDPSASFTFTFQISSDSLFGDPGRTIEELGDTTLMIPADSLAILGSSLYWRVLAVDDDSLVRIGGIPEEERWLRIVLPGDANGDGNVLGGDVTFLVRYFKGLGPAPNPILAGDANGDCQVLGGDVTYLVRYFKGLGSMPSRGNCR